MNQQDSIGCWSLSTLAQKISKNGHSSGKVSKKIIAQAARKFHEEIDCQNRFTSGLINKIGNDNPTIVRLAHQANFFPYTQILAQSLYISKLPNFLKKLNVDSVAIVLIVDIDVSGSKWINTSHLIDKTQKSHIRTMKNGTRRDSEVPSFLCKEPNDEIKLKISNSIDEYSNSKEVDRAFIRDISGIERSFNSLSDFNSYSWVRSMVDIWNLPLVFVRLSDLIATTESHLIDFSKKIGSITNKSYESYLWNVCECCYSRIPYRKTCCLNDATLEVLFPRVILDDLSDYYFLGVSGGTSYKSSVKHMIESHRIAKLAEIKYAPESNWKISGKLCGNKISEGISRRAKDLILGGRVSLLNSFESSEKSEIVKQNLETIILDEISYKNGNII